MKEGNMPFDLVPSEGIPVEALQEDVMAVLSVIHTLDQLHNAHMKQRHEHVDNSRIEDLGDVTDYAAPSRYDKITSSFSSSELRNSAEQIPDEIKSAEESTENRTRKQEKSLVDCEGVKEDTFKRTLESTLYKEGKNMIGRKTTKSPLLEEGKRGGNHKEDKEPGKEAYDGKGMLNLGQKTNKTKDEANSTDKKVEQKSPREVAAKVIEPCNVVKGFLSPKVTTVNPPVPECERQAPVDLKNRMALYDTASHGPPLIGAAIIRHDGVRSHVDFAHPDKLKEKVALKCTGTLKVNDNNSWASADLCAEKELERCFHLVPRLALGAMRDTALIDFVYFNLPTPCGNYLYGISYVARFKKESPSNKKGYMKHKTSSSRSGFDTVNEEVHVEVSDDMGASKDNRVRRGDEAVKSNHYFVAICVISKAPFFCYIGCKLEYIAQVYFHTKCFSDHQLLLSFVEQMNCKELVENWNYESLYFNLESYFKPLSLCVTYRSLLFMVKCILSGKKIVVYSACAARSSTGVLSLLTLIPGASALGFNSAGFGSLWHTWKKFGIPLHLFHSKNVIYPYFTPEMSELIDDIPGYLIGITDRNLIKHLKNKPDMVLNMEGNCIRLFNRRLMEMYYPSMYEVDHFDGYIEKFDSSEDEELIKGLVDTGEAIYNSLSGYLARAPSTLINIGGTVKRFVNRRSSSRGMIKCNESPLELLDKYFPGSVPRWLKKNTISKSSASTSGHNKQRGIMSGKKDQTSSEPTAFTIQSVFNEMAKHSTYYHYLGYLDYIQGYTSNTDRNREIEYAINHRINPMHIYVLKFLEDTAYVCGERRLMCQLLMDFGFDFNALIDCSQHVMGMVLKRGDVYLRGNLPKEGEEAGFLDTLLCLDADLDQIANKIMDSARIATTPGSGRKESEAQKHPQKLDERTKQKTEQWIDDSPISSTKSNKESLTALGYKLASKGRNIISNAMSAGKSDHSKNVDNPHLSKLNQQKPKREDYSEEIKPSYDSDSSKNAAYWDSDRDENSHREKGRQFGKLNGMGSRKPYGNLESPLSNAIKRAQDERDAKQVSLSSASSPSGVLSLSPRLGAEDSNPMVTPESASMLAKERMLQQEMKSVTPNDQSSPRSEDNTSRYEGQSGLVPTSDYSYRLPDDQEVNFDVVGTVATKIMEIQNNHSLDFLERWLVTDCAKKFFDEHNLSVFTEPVYLINSNMAKHKYPNGDVYIGELVHLKREGKGTYISVDGTQYDGYWLGGQRHGMGTLVSTRHGYTYNGEWCNDKREGHGDLSTPLFQYIGTFKDNQFHGRGKLIHKGGPTYEGDFENGKYNGRGRLTMPDGTVKIGSFRNNEIVGVCSVIDTDGRIYVGKLHGDAINGRGKLIYNRLVSFEGEWDKGIRKGQGLAEIKLNDDGSKGSITIEGVWEDDNLIMQEVMIKFPNGYKYVGGVDYCSDLSQLMHVSSYDEKRHSEAEQARMSFDNHLLPHGSGIIKSPSGSSYNGEMSHGMKFGKGDMVFANGLMYTGEWAYGTVHGEACVTFPGSNIPKKLNFKYGQLIGTLEQSELKYIKECLKEIGKPSFEQEFTMANLEPFPGLLTTPPV